MWVSHQLKPSQGSLVEPCKQLATHSDDSCRLSADITMHKSAVTQTGALVPLEVVDPMVEQSLILVSVCHHQHPMRQLAFVSFDGGLQRLIVFVDILEEESDVDTHCHGDGHHHQRQEEAKPDLGDQAVLHALTHCPPRTSSVEIFYAVFISS